MTRYPPAISPGHDSLIQILVADPDVQEKFKGVVLWVPKNIEKVTKGGNLAYGGLNVLGGLARVFSGISEFNANLSELTTEEKIVFCSMILLNIATVISGGFCCFQGKLLHNYNIFILAANNIRRITAKYYPMLLCKGEKRAKLTEIFRLAGGGSTGNRIDDVSIDNNTILSTNVFGRAIRLIPIVGDPLLKLICKASFVLTILTCGLDPNRRANLLIESNPPGIERPTSRNHRLSIGHRSSESITFDKKGGLLRLGPARFTITLY